MHSMLCCCLQIPERRACADRTATDVNAHDPVFSEQVMQVAGQLTKLLCPGEYIVRYGKITMHAFAMMSPQDRGHVSNTEAVAIVLHALRYRFTCICSMSCSLYTRFAAELPVQTQCCAAMIHAGIAEVH